MSNEEEVVSEHPDRAGHYQILSDGRRVWVNGPDGSSVARLAPGSIDIHRSFTEQQETGIECLDCRHDLKGPSAWEYFVRALKDYYGVIVNKQHRPDWAKDGT